MTVGSPHTTEERSIVHHARVCGIWIMDQIMESEFMQVDTPQTLQIKMFGEFSISNDFYSLSTAKKSGLTNFLLMAYLISNKGNHITSETLIDMLWPSGKTTNPGGALRTLIYRIRKDLVNFFPNIPADQSAKLVCMTNNLYSWNFDVPCHIDVYDFKSFCHRASREPDKDKQYALLTQAFNLYTGEFLPVFAHHSWVMFRNNYYGNLYVNCVNKMCNYLDEVGDYQTILDICEKAFEYAPPVDETLCRQKIRALLNLNRAQAALEYYHSVLDMFSHEYGLDVSDSLHDIYQQILTCMPNHYQTISALEANLRQRDSSPGSFYCNFDVFQNIYQINLRSTRRSQRLRFLILLTLRDSKDSTGISDDLKEEMAILQQVMESKLRTNDVYTKSSICQYSLIIAATNESGCEVVRNRLLTTYNAKKQHKHVSLTIESKEIL